MDCGVVLIFLTFLLFCSILPAERTKEEDQEQEEERLSPGLTARLNTSTFTPCSSSSGSKGVKCAGFDLGDGCLRDFLWCRDDLVVVCGDHGLTSNNDLFCGNQADYWSTSMSRTMP